MGQAEACGQAAVADVHHVFAALEAVHRFFEIRGNGSDALDHIFAHQHIQSGNARRARHGVRRVGVAVGEFEHVLRTAAFHEGVVNIFFGHYATQWHSTVSHLLGHVHDVGRHAKSGSTGVGTQTTKAGDDFIKNQQDVVGRANFAQALQIAHRWHHHATRT